MGGVGGWAVRQVLVGVVGRSVGGLRGPGRGRRRDGEFSRLSGRPVESEKVAQLRLFTRKL